MKRKTSMIHGPPPLYCTPDLADIFWKIEKSLFDLEQKIMHPNIAKHWHKEECIDFIKRYENCTK